MQKNRAYKEDLVAEVRADFEKRATERKLFEAQWQLNANFVLGNQYCFCTASGEVETSDRDYFWQEREVFNHVAPVVETRLAKLGRIRPTMSVRPASNDENDILTGKAASKILSSACRKLELDALINRATMWSEITGSAFYKVTWNAVGGTQVGELNGNTVYEGEVKVDVCPSYEIYPDAISNQTVDECQSIMHAKAVSIDEIRRIWGKSVKPDQSDMITMQNISVIGGLGQQSAVPVLSRSESSLHCLVIERYTRPTTDLANGELVIIAGDELLYRGDLPYLNGTDFKRDLPFIKQDALTHAGCFYGSSMVERIIPIQRAFNAVKNRKHEFMNRIAMGVLAVEDGSVDTENLEEEGLSPGKILVYRQGSRPPSLMDPGRVPSDFTLEEDRLLSEFVSISGVSEIMRSSSVPSGITSGVALQLLVEQDDTRLSVTAEQVRDAIKRVGQHMLRLYKQFASQPRLVRFVGEEGDVELLSWKASDIGCDDVIFDTENELSSSPAAKQSMMFDLLKMGLLQDENGKLSDAMRYKILDAIGYGGWESTRDIAAMQVSNAQRENRKATSGDLEVDEVDDHNLHIAEHTKFYLSSDFEKQVKRKPALKQRVLMHIRAHKAALQPKEAAEIVKE